MNGKIKAQRGRALSSATEQPGQAVHGQDQSCFAAFLVLSVRWSSVCMWAHTCADQGCLLQLWQKWKPEPTTATWSGAIAPLSSLGSGLLGVGLLQRVQFTASTMSRVLPVLALGQAPLPRWASLSSL